MKTVTLTKSQQIDLLVLVSEKINDLILLKTSAQTFGCEKDVNFIKDRILDYEKLKNLLF